VKLLTATTETQGQRASDFAWCVPGEVVTPVRLICDRDRNEGPDGGCGCGRSFTGLSSSKGTTTAIVTDIDGYTIDDLVDALRSRADPDDQDDDAAELAPEEATLIAETAAMYDEGTVLEIRLSEIAARSQGDR
jgi:hypothetical protein